MLVHYVEDDENDAQYIRAIAQESGEIDITTSPTIEGIKSRIESHPVDCIMLDVNRPDSVSIDNDIQLVRRYTRAPIVFITGMEAEELRFPAALAGADAVIEKMSLNSSVLKQVFHNANARYFAKIQSPVFEKTPDNVLPNFNLKQLDVPLEYLETSLMALIEVLTDSRKTVSVGYVSHMFETVKAIREYSNSNLRDTSRVLLGDILARVENHAKDLALSREVSFAMESEYSIYSQIGSSILASIGLRHLFEGLVRCCSKGDKIWVTSEKNAEQSAIKIYLSRRVLDSSDVFWKSLTKSSTVGTDALSSLHLAAMLLNLRQQQISLDDNNGGQVLRLLL